MSDLIITPRDSAHNTPTNQPTDPPIEPVPPRHDEAMTDEAYVKRSKRLSYEAMEACDALKHARYVAFPFEASYDRFVAAESRYWEVGKQWLELAYDYVEANGCSRQSVEGVFDDLFAFYLCSTDEDFLDYPLNLLTDWCHRGHDPSFRPGHAAILKYMPYHLYLRTFHWELTRDAARERAGDRCQVCNSAGLLDVHHRTYERRGAELPEDLIVLCRKCHDTFHKNGRLAR